MHGKAPSPEQIALAYEVAYNMEGQTHYEARMGKERARGSRLPHVRQSRTVSSQVALAAAELLFERDRELFRSKKLQEMAWAQDGGEGIMYMKVKLLLAGSWESTVRLLRAFPQEHYKAMELVEAMEYARNRFATPFGAAEPEGPIVDEMKQLCRNLCVDGEAAEQLAIRLSSTKGVWPRADE